MANCINYDCDDALLPYLNNDCGEELLAGISGFIILECNTQLTDPSSAAQISAEIAAGRAQLINGVKIGFDAPAAIEQEQTQVGATPKVVSYNRSGTIEDANVSSTNIDFYNQLFGGKTFGGMIAYVKGTEESTNGAQVLYIDAAITMSGGMPVKNNNDEAMKFIGKFAWRKKDMPQIYSAPTGIF